MKKKRGDLSSSSLHLLSNPLLMAPADWVQQCSDIAADLRHPEVRRSESYISACAVIYLSVDLQVVHLLRPSWIIKLAESEKLCNRFWPIHMTDLIRNKIQLEDEFQFCSCRSTS